MTNHSRKVTMAVYREQTDDGGESALPERWRLEPGIQQAIYLIKGGLQVGGDRYAEGDGFCLQKNTESMTCNSGTELLRFVFCSSERSSGELEEMLRSQASTGTLHTALVLHQTYSTCELGAVLRLDRVDFPPGAIAYRHTHPGGGLRYLTTGSLKLDATGDIHQYAADEAWFEDANSPVLATADASQRSQFVRMMLLPASFEGKSTFTYMDEADAQKPRLQTNIRYFDLALRLDG